MVLPQYVRNVWSSQGYSTNEHGTTEGRMPARELGDDYQNRWVVLVSDGLSPVRLQSFREIIGKTTNSASKHRDSAVVVEKALHVNAFMSLMISGGGFHKRDGI